MTSLLAYLRPLLDQKDIPCTLLEASSEVPYDRLIAVIGKNALNEEFVLEITVYPQTFKTSPHEKEGSEYGLIQFQYIFPSQVVSSAMQQVSSSLHFFNRLLHLPGFELDELHDQVLYRYSWLVKKSGIDLFLLSQVIGNIQLCLQLFYPYIKEIIEGHLTLNDILEKMIELSKKINEPQKE